MYGLKVSNRKLTLVFIPHVDIVYGEGYLSCRVDLCVSYLLCRRSHNGGILVVTLVNKVVSAVAALQR